MQKIILSILFVMMYSIIPTSSFAQGNNSLTDTITVFGNCGQCKSRIEEAAYVKGVKHAEWNKTTKLLKVVFNPEKTSIDKITTAIASAGHDSRLHTATDKSYKKLPSCCAYRTGECHHD